MNTACMGCRTSNPNLLDKPTGRLYCIKCGAEIVISDPIRNMLAKKNMFMAARPAAAPAPGRPISMPPPPRQQAPAWQNWDPNAPAAAQRPQPRPQYERPVARPSENNQQAAVQAAKARLAKIHKSAGIRDDQGSPVGHEEIREGVVQYSEKTREEAAEYRQYVKESLESYDGGVNLTRYMPKTDFVREEFSKLGISVDALDGAIKGTAD